MRIASRFTGFSAAAVSLALTLPFRRKRSSRAQDTEHTGDGCIAVWPARRFPDTRFRAALSISAPAVARSAFALLSEVDGATGHWYGYQRGGAGNRGGKCWRATDCPGDFSTRCGDWFEAVEGIFDLIVSNPPYIPKADLQTLDPEVIQFDPHIALDGGPDGLDAYHAIAAHAGQHLAPRGHIVVETGFDQHDAVLRGI